MTLVDPLCARSAKQIFHVRVVRYGVLCLKGGDTRGKGAIYPTSGNLRRDGKRTAPVGGSAATGSSPDGTAVIAGSDEAGRTGRQTRNYVAAQAHLIYY